MSNRFIVDLRTELLDYQLYVLGITEDNARNTELQTIDLEGLHYLVPGKGIATENPFGWEPFLDELRNQNLQSFMPANSYDSIKKAHKEWINFRAKRALMSIQNGDSDYYELREYSPILFETSIIQSAFANHFIENRGVKGAVKKGRPAADNRDLLNLCGWAAYYYCEDVTLSLRTACELAVSNHPELVPDSWNLKPCDPEDREFELGDRLEKNIDRIEKQYPEYGLKEYREARNRK